MAVSIIDRVSESVVTNFDGELHGLFDVLTNREREILSMTVDGSTNNDIARRLSLSVSAVKFHLASIYRKLGVANRTEAAFCFLRAGGVPARADDAGRRDTHGSNPWT